MRAGQHRDRRAVGRAAAQARGPCGNRDRYENARAQQKACRRGVYYLQAEDRGPRSGNEPCHRGMHL